MSHVTHVNGCSACQEEKWLEARCHACAASDAEESDEVGRDGEGKGMLVAPGATAAISDSVVVAKHG